MLQLSARGGDALSVQRSRPDSYPRSLAASKVQAMSLGICMRSAPVVFGELGKCLLSHMHQRSANAQAFCRHCIVRLHRQSSNTGDSPISRRAVDCIAFMVLREPFRKADIRKDSAKSSRCLSARQCCLLIPQKPVSNSFIRCRPETAPDKEPVVLPSICMRV